MAWTRHSYSAAALETAPQDGTPFVSLFGLIDDLLASGGDSRLTLSAPARENSYGCTPFPRDAVADFASSTASSISTEAYDRAKAARDALMARALRDGMEEACEAAAAAARAALSTQLKLASGTGIVFAPSGTDAQLHALFLARALLPRPLTTIIAGSDQTGSGTAHTCKGRHFSQITSRGWAVEKGSVIAGLADSLAGVEIAFGKADGTFRSADEMDDAVRAAVGAATAAGRGVLLQAMEASKFGWKAPSDACLDEIARRWPGQVQVVVDACQLRLSRTRLNNLLARNCWVLITGSKFFTGPAFSGALLLPPAICDQISGLDQTSFAAGLAGYGTRHDWPQGWSLRDRFCDTLNLGQWLRWEAALEEMRLYYAVPKTFRDAFARRFADTLNGLIGRTSCLTLLPTNLETHNPTLPTVFAVGLSDGAKPLPATDCGEVYRALRRDVSSLLPPASDVDLSRPVQLGQPVSLAARGTAMLRISTSARMMRSCWSDDAQAAERNITQLLESLAGAVAKLDHLARHAGRLAQG